MTTASVAGLTPDLYGYAHCAVCGELRKTLVDGRCETKCEGRTVEAEREACARLVEQIWVDACSHGTMPALLGGEALAAAAKAIRARGA